MRIPVAILLLGVALCDQATGQPSKAEVDQFHLSALEYPTAESCAKCHPSQYEQWSVSPHSYGAISPVYNAMSAFMNKETNGTLQDFCHRCHIPVGMARGEPIFASNSSRAQASREDITCTVCHRVNKAYGKVSGRLPFADGDVYAPVYGPNGGEELQRVQESSEFIVATEAGQERRMPIHLKAERLFQMSDSEFCGTCHDILSPGGLRLQETFSEWAGSPAAEQGVSCQDCHMGKEPGVFLGEDNYDYGPAAIVDGKPTRPRRLTNHTIPGPDYSIVHPGVYPNNREAVDLASVDEWLQFDYKEGWGTDAFEDTVSLDREFPDRWFEPDDRYEAREVLERQFDVLNSYMEQRARLLRNGFAIGDIVTKQANEKGLHFKVEVRNITNGHNVPTGFSMRLVFLHVVVEDREGNVVFVSGDQDPNGDLRDAYSEYVRHGKLPRDEQLFNLQPKFVLRNLRGGEREMVLSLNHSLAPLPFQRPQRGPTVLSGRPRGGRIQRKSIPPNGSRWAEYDVRGQELAGRGPFRARVRLIMPMVPAHLINEIQSVGFDYGMSPRQVAAEIISRQTVLYEYAATIDTEKGVDHVDWTRQETPPDVWYADN